MGIRSKLYNAYAKHADTEDAVRFALILFGSDADKEDNGWRTTENGKHYHIDPDGNVDKGPKAMVGTNVNEPDTWDDKQPVSKRTSSRFIKGSLPQFKSLAEKAKKYKDDYDAWSTELTVDECEAIQANYKKMVDADPNFGEDDHYETISDYYERMYRMLAAAPEGKDHKNHPVDGKDLSSTYEWDGKSYTDTKYGQVIDTQIEDIICKQGFDGVPKIMKKDEFDQFIKDNPNAPIMMRTFSAPTKEMLDGYDADLENGAWYVDCGVGGCAHGQGMYTAYSDTNVQIVSTDFPVNWEKARKNGHFGYGLYVYNHDQSMYFRPKGISEITRFNVESLDKGQAIWFYGETIDENDEYGINAKIYIYDGNDKWIDADNGEVVEKGYYDLNGDYQYMALCEEVSKGSVPDPSSKDLSIPLGQMRMYINLNEKREGEFAYKEYKQECANLAQDATTEDEPISISSPMPDTVCTYDFKNNYVFFDVTDKGGESLSDKCKNGFDEFDLEPGYYVITYDHSSNPELRDFEMVEMTEDGFLLRVRSGDAVEMTDYDRSFSTNGLSRHPVIHKCEDISPKKPESGVATTTRMMTLDPSAKLVKESELNDKSIEIRTNIEQKQKQAIAEAVRNYQPKDNSITEEELKLIKDSAGSSGGDDDVFLDKLEFVDSWADVKVQQRWKNLSPDRFKALKNELELMDQNTQEVYDSYERKKLLSHDVGVVAALLGYDGIIGCDVDGTCPNYGQTIVVLNRSKLIMSEERVDVPEDIPT